MNKFATIVLSFTAGAIAGFTVAQFISFEKDETKKVTAEDLKNEIEKKPSGEKPVDPAETENPKDDDPEEFISRGPAHIAQPGQTGINYSKVNEIIKENGYTTQEEIEDVLNDPENEETYEERIEREEIERSQAMTEYRKKNKDKIVPIQSDEWNTDFPENDYDHKDLHYFVTDDVLTDEDNNVLDEAEYIGVRPRQFGWMNNSEQKIYIRNNPKETEYQVWKHECSRDEWWG